MVKWEFENVRDGRRPLAAALGVNKTAQQLH